LQVLVLGQSKDCEPNQSVSGNGLRVRISSSSYFRRWLAV
jgi:hypothetical protein